MPVSAENLGTLRAAMRQSVTAGWRRTPLSAGVEVAGKTGTAEFGPRLSNGKYATHGWFVGFAPYNDPQIAIVVFVQRGSGGDDASPGGGEDPRLLLQRAPTGSTGGPAVMIYRRAARHFDFLLLLFAGGPCRLRWHSDLQRSARAPIPTE